MKSASPYALLLGELLRDLGMAAGDIDDETVVDYETDDLLITLQPTRDATALLVEIDLARANDEGEAANVRSRVLHELNALARHAHDSVIVRIDDVYVLSRVVVLAGTTLNDLKAAIESVMTSARSLRQSWDALDTLLATPATGGIPMRYA